MRNRWLACAVATLACGCGTPPAPPVTMTWLVGHPAPLFDPEGPPDPVRWAIERLLARGLVEEAASGAIVMAAAETVTVSADRRTYTFRLRPGLEYSDGRDCTSTDFRVALERGLQRLDHGTAAWLLAAVRGVEEVRPGRPLPRLGIETPDPATLVLRLSRPDPELLRKLATPGVGVPWRRPGAESWSDGLGSYRVADHGGPQLTLARRGRRADLPDTIRIRFVSSVGRVRGWLRDQAADLVWPPAPDLLDQPLAPGYRARTAPARPERRLLLILRADLPPTSRVAARHALASGLARDEVIAALGRSAAPAREWLPGGGPLALPRRDVNEVRQWLARGKLGRSLHAVMAYASDGPAARVAPVLQGGWARLGLYVELRPLRRPQSTSLWLRTGGAQLLLVEAQAPVAGLAGELAMLALPRRGPPVGAFRSGWVTRELDAAIAGTAPRDVAALQQRILDERVAIPVAELPWHWVERSGGAGRSHPRFGPEIATFAPPRPTR